MFKAPLLQFYRLVPHETPPPGSLSEDSLLLPGRHQFELVGDVGFHDFNPTPSFSRTHASHEFVRRGFERLSSRQLKPRVFSARLYKIELIPGLTEKIAHTLNMEGVKYTHHLLDRVRTPSKRRFLANHLGVDEKLILRWANHSDLIRIHGIGPQYAESLEAAGVDTVRELAHRVPEDLLAKLEELNAANPMTKRVPALKEIKRYVQEAQQLEPMLEY